MNILIVAAGKGHRLLPYTHSTPKALVKLWGKSLISWQMDIFKQSNLLSKGIVVGYLKEKFSHFPFDYVAYNDIWMSSNMLYSLYMAHDFLQDQTTIMSYGDIIYDQTVIDDLSKEEGDIVVLSNKNWKNLWEIRFENPLSDAESFIVDESTKKLVSIGDKNPSIENIHGQYMGLIKFSPKGWHNFYKHIHKVPLKDVSITEYLNFLLTKNVLINVCTTSGKIYEVDHASDLELYENKSPWFSY